MLCLTFLTAIFPWHGVNVGDQSERRVVLRSVVRLEILDLADVCGVSYFIY